MKTSLAKNTRAGNQTSVKNDSTFVKCALAGVRPPVAVDMEILSADGSLADPAELRDFATRFDLKLISIPQLCEWLDIGQGAAMPVQAAAAS